MIEIKGNMRDRGHTERKGAIETESGWRGRGHQDRTERK